MLSDSNDSSRARNDEHFGVFFFSLFHRAALVLSQRRETERGVPKGVRHSIELPRSCFLFQASRVWNRHSHRGSLIIDSFSSSLRDIERLNEATLFAFG